MIVVSHFTLTKHTSYVIQTDILCYKRALKKLNNIITCMQRIIMASNG